MEVRDYFVGVIKVVRIGVVLKICRVQSVADLFVFLSTFATAASDSLMPYRESLFSFVSRYSKAVRSLLFLRTTPSEQNYKSGQNLSFYLNALCE